MEVGIKIDKETAVKKIEKKDNIFSRKIVVNSIELLHLNYYLFKARIDSQKSKTIIQHICVDGIDGEYAFVENEKLDYSLTDSSKKIEMDLPEEEAAAIAKQAVKSMLMVQKGKGADISNIEVSLEAKIRYPYWVAYFKRKSGIDFEVVDAVNGKKQGAKMKPVFIKLIIQ